MHLHLGLNNINKIEGLQNWGRVRHLDSSLIDVIKGKVLLAWLVVQLESAAPPIACGGEGVGEQVPAVEGQRQLAHHHVVSTARLVTIARATLLRQVDPRENAITIRGDAKSKQGDARGGSSLHSKAANPSRGAKGATAVTVRTKKVSLQEQLLLDAQMSTNRSEGPSPSLLLQEDRALAANSASQTTGTGEKGSHVFALPSSGGLVVELD